jgi:S1-C subfamily serine protease
MSDVHRSSLGVSGTATVCVVIGSGAEFPEFQTSGREFIAASLHMQPGNSGRPLVDGQGRLVGVSAMINGPDVDIAMPVHRIKAFLREVGEINPVWQPQFAESMLV